MPPSTHQIHLAAAAEIKEMRDIAQSAIDRAILLRQGDHSAPLCAMRLSRFDQLCIHHGEAAVFGPVADPCVVTAARALAAADRALTRLHDGLDALLFGPRETANDARTNA